MFPATWTYDDILQNVLEAYRNPAGKVTYQCGSIRLDSFSRDGIKISIVTDATGRRFRSCFPTIE